MALHMVPLGPSMALQVIPFIVSDHPSCSLARPQTFTRESSMKQGSLLKSELKSPGYEWRACTHHHAAMSHTILVPRHVQMSRVPLFYLALKSHSKKSRRGQATHNTLPCPYALYSTHQSGCRINRERANLTRLLMLLEGDWSMISCCQSRERQQKPSSLYSCAYHLATGRAFVTATVHRLYCSVLSAHRVVPHRHTPNTELILLHDQ